MLVEIMESIVTVAPYHSPNVNLTPYHLVISREAGALSGTSRSCTRLARLI